MRPGAESLWHSPCRSRTPGRLLFLGKRGVPVERRELQPFGLSPCVFAQEDAAEFGEVAIVGVVEDADDGFPVDRLQADHARFAVVRRLKPFSGADEFGGAESKREVEHETVGDRDAGQEHPSTVDLGAGVTDRLLTADEALRG